MFAELKPNKGGGGENRTCPGKPSGVGRPLQARASRPETEARQDLAWGPHAKPGALWGGAGQGRDLCGRRAPRPQGLAVFFRQRDPAVS